MTQTPNESGRVPVEPPTGRRRGDRGATPSRVGSLWVASILFAVVLLLLLIFVLQNGQSATISYLGAHGSVPQGVALLLAAVFGILLVALPGTARIIQLRLRDRRHRSASRTRPPVDTGPATLGGTDSAVTDSAGTGAGTTAAPSTQAAPLDVNPPATNPQSTNPLTGNAPEAGAPETDAPATNAPMTPVATPPTSPRPPAQPPPADPR
jgi:uncharacterized integral membrane protein